MKESIDESYQLLAGRHFRRQLNALTRQFEGIRQNVDSECVHKARVASRRLRAGLQMFDGCFPAGKYKKWRKEVRRTTKQLGAARDKDVAIMSVRQLLDALPEKQHRAGIKRFLLRLEQQRKILQPQVIKVVERLDSGSILDEMYSETGRILFGLKRHRVSVQSPYVFQQVRRHVQKKLDGLMSYQDSLANPHDYKRHHLMRIAAKRLRYTLEICRTVYSGRLDNIIKAIKRLQTLLGNVHDYDVRAERLQTFLEEEHQRTVDYFGHARPFARLKVGIEYCQQDCLSQREQMFEKLTDYWQKLNEQKLWEKLVQIIREPMEPAGTAEQPAEIELLTDVKQPMETEQPTEVKQPDERSQPAEQSQPADKTSAVEPEQINVSQETAEAARATKPELSSDRKPGE
ncbi:MAG: CHAD domain-containing protein [Sedimentisphaerales bacterium]|nr:CHAD domain-containing protein [Sedimentisphaerales bacterium]